MHPSYRSRLLLGLLTLGLFSLFYWLFRLALPDAALAFAIGTTTIIMGGVLTGRFAAKWWYKPGSKQINTAMVLLAGAALLGLIGMATLMNRMIEKTEFHHFFFTILCLFIASGCIAAIGSLVSLQAKARVAAAQAAMVQSRTELQLLQSQLSPHFLFNTLNNLYGLSITNHQKVPELLLRLSDLLRYSVYEAKEAFVPLRDEVSYLRNYIAFEQVRLGERLELKAEFPDLTDQIRIAPMLLIVFVENAFKHSKNTEDAKVKVAVSLKAEPDQLVFAVTNSCAPPPPVMVADSHSGFGLENVRKRLALLYPNRHELHISREARTFSVTLTLQSHENQVPDSR